MPRDNILLVCEACKNQNYITKRNKKKQTNKIACIKFCKNCRTHKMHKEKK